MAAANAAASPPAGQSGSPRPAAKRRRTSEAQTEVEPWSHEEDRLIMRMVAQHGRRWSMIATHLPWRTDNGVRNRWDRLERADKMRSEHGYRCRRCGQLKRGHVCLGISSRSMAANSTEPSSPTNVPSSPEPEGTPRSAQSSLSALAEATATAEAGYLHLPHVMEMDYLGRLAYLPEHPLSREDTNDTQDAITPPQSPTPSSQSPTPHGSPSPQPVFCPEPPVRRPEPLASAPANNSSSSSGSGLSPSGLSPTELKKQAKGSHRRERSYDAANLLLIFARTALGDPNLGKIPAM